MIELTKEQLRELGELEPVAIDPRTQQVYILVRKEIYERMQKLLSYHDSPWTDEEMNLSAEEAGELLDKYRPYEDDGPMTPEEIARTLAAMEKIEPLDMSCEERATLEADRQARKEWEKAHFDERAVKLQRNWK